VHKQINYIFDENELFEKSLNSVLSLVFNKIKLLNKGKKHLKITYVNRGEQNKNNTILWFYIYLVIAGVNPNYNSNR